MKFPNLGYPDFHINPHSFTTIRRLSNKLQHKFCKFPVVPSFTRLVNGKRKSSCRVRIILCTYMYITMSSPIRGTKVFILNFNVTISYFPLILEASTKGHTTVRARFCCRKLFKNNGCCGCCQWQFLTTL